MPNDSFSNVVDLSPYFSGETYAAAPDRGRFLLARTTYVSEHGGDAVLLIGTEERVTIWLNGVRQEPVMQPSRILVPDANTCNVSLKAGPNDLLLQVEGNAGDSCRLTARIVPKGTVLSPVAELVPQVEADATGLHVTTDVQSRRGGAPVQVTVCAPGGREVARGQASREDAIVFPTGSWAPGPYEIRCSSTTSWGEPSTAYAYWNKGDVLQIAENRLQLPRAPGTDLLTQTEDAVLAILRERVAEAKAKNGETLSTRPELLSPLIELAELEQERRGISSRVRPGGFCRLAFVDPVDHSTQFCRAYLPANYDPGKRWPLVVSLHGYNPANPVYSHWWSVDARHNAQSDKRDVIVLEPHGRGNAQYLGMGEEDVMRALKEAKRRFSVDDDRVYLTGESMGGSGAWLIGSRHVDEFAAIAPTYGGWDIRVVAPVGGPVMHPRNAREDFALERNGSFSSAEQLLNTPIYLHHGDADRSVPVECSRQIVQQLQRWGYNILYREMPGYGHEDIEAQDEIFSWLLRQRRKPAPRHVRVRAADLRGAQADWLQVTAFSEPQKLIRADAEFVEPGLLRLDTDNAASVVLRPPAALLATDRQLRVIWNGRPAFNGALGDQPVVLENEGTGNDRKPKKSAGVEGPISDVIRTPFMLVVGTVGDDPAMQQRCREKADAFADLWESWQHVRPRIIDDVAISESDEHALSLILIGGPAVNRVAQRLADQLPLSVSPDGVTIDGRRWSVKDAVAQMIFPHPFAADKYVLLVAATSADGMYFWNPALWDVTYGFPNNLNDWVIQDGHRPAPDSAADARVNIVASGLFDSHWHRDDRWTMETDATVRASSVIRQAPPLKGGAGDPSSRDACLGLYELAPGIYARAERAGGGLALRIAGGAPILLREEKDYEFAVARTSQPAVFNRAPNGAVTELVLYNDSGVTRWKRIH